ncbi:MAG: porin [Pseudomonadota bacterium]
MGLLLCGQAQAQERVITPSAWDWRLGGTLQGDALLASSLPEDQNKSTELRRARIGARLVLSEAVRFSASADFSQGERLGDLFFDVRRGPVSFNIGRFPEPFGLQAQESSRTTPLMERALPTALGPGYGLGAAFNHAGRNWALSAGLFKAHGALSDEDLLKGGRKEDAATVRLTGTAFRSPERVLHLGLAGSLRRPDEEAVRFISIPESVLVRGLQVSSGLLPVDDFYTLIGGELALRQGPVLLQGEFIRAAIRLDSELPESRYYGGYAEAAWAITGERRPYSSRAGVFGPITPQSRWNEGRFGAWEVAARYSQVDFSKNPLEDIEGFEEFDDFGLFTGGRGRVLSLGLNWYPTALTRVALNGLRIVKQREGVREEADVVQMRVYIQFDVRRSDLE